MEEHVSLYIYIDYLLDPRFPKNFSENSDRALITSALSTYFDEAFDLKGFDFQKFEKSGFAEVAERRPLRYDEIKKLIVGMVSDNLHKNQVFSIISHPLFGRKCEVDSEKFFKILDELKGSIQLSKGGASLQSDINQWGIDRFKTGLSSVYRSLGGSFNSATWTDFADGTGRMHGDELELPSVDAIVAVDHDAPDVIEIQRLGAQLVEHLQSTNDLGSMTRDEASAAAGEIRQIMTAFEASRLRKKYVLDKAKGTLEWIISKSSDALFGAVAGALLAAIVAYFGYSL